jgi:hypothetical protein
LTRGAASARRPSGSFHGSGTQIARSPRRRLRRLAGDVRGVSVERLRDCGGCNRCRGALEGVGALPGGDRARSVVARHGRATGHRTPAAGRAHSTHSRRGRLGCGRASRRAVRMGRVSRQAMPSRSAVGVHRANDRGRARSSREVTPRGGRARSTQRAQVARRASLAIGITAVHDG